MFLVEDICYVFKNLSLQNLLFGEDLVRVLWTSSRMLAIPETQTRARLCTYLYTVLLITVVTAIVHSVAAQVLGHPNSIVTAKPVLEAPRTELVGPVEAVLYAVAPLVG